MTKKLIIAHRGASSLTKENTIESFEKAIACDSDMIEFDVRKTRDGICIVYHDEFINDKMINELKYKQIKEIDGSIPTLEEILKLTKGKIRLDVELKEDAYEEEVIKMLLRYFKEDEFVITSFNDESLRTIKSSYPNLRVGLLLGKNKPRNLVITRLSELFPFKRVIQSKADFIVPHWKLLRFGFLGRAERKHKPVWVWTVNDKAKIKAFLNDSRIETIITDKPDLAISLRKEITSPNSR